MPKALQRLLLMACPIVVVLIFLFFRAGGPVIKDVEPALPPPAPFAPQLPRAPAPRATPKGGPAPTFNVERGLYATNLTIAIRSELPNAMVRFTLDGSEPGQENGSTYSQPIVLSNTTVLRAASFLGESRSQIGTQTYLFPEATAQEMLALPIGKRKNVNVDRIQRALLALPSVSLATPGAQHLNARLPGVLRFSRPVPAVQASMEWLDSDRSASAQVDCGVATFGGEYSNYEKKCFRLYFRVQYGAKKFNCPLFVGHEHGLMAVEEFDQLDLRSGSHDMEERGFYMSNIFADDSLLEMGHLNPHGRFVHVYLNGAYWGVYHLRERWNAAMHRRYLGGTTADYESINGNQNIGGWANPGKPYDGDGSTWSRALGLRKNYRAAQQWVDLPQYIDFMLVWMYGSCEDEYRCVGAKIPGLGFKFYLNDADGFFQSPAHPWYHFPFNRTRGSPGGSGQLPGDGPGGLFSGLLTEGNPEYRILLADRIYHALFNSGPLTPSSVAARLESRCAEFEPALVAEAARWGYRSVESWREVRDDVLQHWVPDRTASLIQELRSNKLYPAIDPPILNQKGGRVATGFPIVFKGAPEASIFYTVDGLDPRASGGAPGPSARRANEAPLHIVDNTWVKCRSRVNNQWSALNEAYFQTSPDAFEPGTIHIEERAVGGGPNGTARFLQLSTASSAAVNLRGARLADGIHFVFPTFKDVPLAPGQTLNLTRDLLAIRKCGQLELPVFGIYTGKWQQGSELRAAPVSPVAGTESEAALGLSPVPASAKAK